MVKLSDRKDLIDLSKKTFKTLRGIAIFTIVVSSIASMVITGVLVAREQIDVLFAVIGLFGLPLVLAVGGGFLVSFASNLFYAKYYDKLPEFTVQAKIVSKESEQHVSGTVSRTTTSYSYAIVCEYDNQREIFYVDSSVFLLLEEDETGLLTYKKDENVLIFIDFERNS